MGISMDGEGSDIEHRSRVMPASSIQPPSIYLPQALIVQGIIKALFRFLDVQIGLVFQQIDGLGLPAAGSCARSHPSEPASASAEGAPSFWGAVKISTRTWMPLPALISSTINSMDSSGDSGSNEF